MKHLTASAAGLFVLSVALSTPSLASPKQDAFWAHEKFCFERFLTEDHCPVPPRGPAESIHSLEGDYTQPPAVEADEPDQPEVTPDKPKHKHKFKHKKWRWKHWR